MSCDSYTFISYKLAECGSCLTTNTSFQNESGNSAFEPRVPITVKLKKLLKDVEIQTKYENVYFFGGGASKGIKVIVVINNLQT